MDRIKTLCGFLLLFAGAGYLTMWAVLFAAAFVMGESVHSDFLSPSMHAAGVTAATLTAARVLEHFRQRNRKPAPQPVNPLMLRPALQRRLQPQPRPQAPRAEFGLRRLHR